MQGRIHIVLAGLALALTSLAANAAPASKASLTASKASLTLAQNGKSRYVIALASDAIPAEKTAARELAEHLEKISGAKFSIKTETAVNADAPQILVGTGVRAKKLLPSQRWTAPGSDGIVIKTVGRNLILAGDRPRGSLYAVHTFLEDSLGVRWWTPTESTIPTRRTLSIPAQNTAYAPQIRTREAFYNSVQQDPQFATRLKINGHYQSQKPEWGGHNSILGWCHTFDQLLPPEKYFKQHPEWYSDPANGGKPCTPASKMPEPQRSQICLTNEAARLELTKNALAWIRENPEAGMISISQNDNYNKYNGPADLALEAREGSPAGPLLHFVNAVAADIEKEFPGFMVETLAYVYTRKPPRYVRPRDNVVIRLCSFEADFSRPLDSDANAAFRDDVLGWKKIAPRLFVWDYVTNFRNVTLPHPNRHVLGANIRFFAANNVIGLFEQGDAYSNGTGDFVAMRVWLLSHLMWNPSLDQKQLENEFLRGYYGDAAPHLRAYLDGIENAFVKSGEKLSTFQRQHNYLTLEAMNDATRYFKLASDAVADNPTLSQRVRRERLALDHAWILRHTVLQREASRNNAVFEGPANLSAAIKEFVATARSFEIPKKGEKRPFETYALQLLAYARALDGNKAPLPEFALDKKTGDVIDVQEQDFHFYRMGDLVPIVDDATASNGRAAKMTGNTREQATQYPIDDTDEFLSDGVWRCYAVVRVQPLADAAPGPVLSCGLYDVKNNKEIVVAVRTLADLNKNGKASEYQTIDMGAYPLHSQMYLFVAPSERKDIEAVFVDRFVLVRETQ